MEKVRLGDIFEYLPKSKLKAGDGKKTGKYKFFTSSNIQDKYVDEFIYDGEYLIFGTGGNASINYCNEKFSTSTDNFVVKVNGNFNTKLIYLYFKNDMSKLEKGFKGASIKHISKEYINQLYIPKYDLEAQEDIVKKLNRVQEIIDIRKKQIEELEELIKSQFVDMFGNENFEKKTLYDITSKITDGSHNPPSGIAENLGYMMLSSQNVINDKINYDNARYLRKEDFEKENARTDLKNGDVLLTIVGTVGRTAIISNEKNITLQRSVAVLEPIKEIKSEYLVGALKSDDVVKQLNKGAKGVAQKGIYLNDLKKLMIPVPPIELQDKFAEIVRQIDKQKFEIQKNLEEMQKLQESLMNKYFG